MTATVANPEVIAAPIQMHADASDGTNPLYTLSNSAASAANTLTLSGAITGNVSASRPTAFVLAWATNTGNNIISGALSDPSFGQGVAVITKNGTGTWILSWRQHVLQQHGHDCEHGKRHPDQRRRRWWRKTIPHWEATPMTVNNYINNGGTLQLNSSGPNGSITLSSNLTLNLKQRRYAQHQRQ